MAELLFTIILSLGLYPKSATVTEIDLTANVVMVEDNNGDLWTWEGVEDWQVGDKAALIMYGNETPTIYDDTIVCARYQGR